MALMSALGHKPSVWGWPVEVVEFSNLNTRIHSLCEEEHEVGRDKSSSIVLGEALCRALTEETSEEDGERVGPTGVSRLHFVVSKMMGDEMAVLTDLSLNGTWINGVKVGQERKMILPHCATISLLEQKSKVFQYLDRATMDSLYPSQVTSKYLVSDFLGDGSTAKVMKAFKNNTKKVEAVALKMIRTQGWGTNYTKPKDMMKEVDIQRGLKHPSLVKIEEVILTANMMVLVMELVKGGDLFDEIHKGGGQVKLRKEIEVKVQFYQLAHCVRYLHSQNISHRDLKLENILTSSPTSSRVKITDFGLAKVSMSELSSPVLIVKSDMEGLQRQQAHEDLRWDPLLHGTRSHLNGEEGVPQDRKLQSEGRLLVPGRHSLLHVIRLFCIP